MYGSFNDEIKKKSYFKLKQIKHSWYSKIKPNNNQQQILYRYDEVCQYNFDQPNFNSDTGHFTEVVWSGSRKLGVGYSVGRNIKFPGYVCVYVVGRYSPAGNNVGPQNLRNNVRRGSFNGSYCTPKIKPPAFTLVPLYKRNRFGNKAFYNKQG